VIERRSFTSPTAPALLTFKEAMDFLRVSRSTIYRLMWSGHLRGHKVGSMWRFYADDLQAAVASQDMAQDMAAAGAPALVSDERRA
jgi:excisionase family DNA binding protein